MPILTAAQRERVAYIRSLAGVRHVAFARSTGALVAVYDGHAQGLDTDGGRWSTVCEDHGSVVAHEMLKLAISHAAAPEGWCDDCREARP